MMCVHSDVCGDIYIVIWVQGYVGSTVCSDLCSEVYGYRKVLYMWNVGCRKGARECMCILVVMYV